MIFDPRLMLWSPFGPSHMISYDGTDYWAWCADWGNPIWDGNDIPVTMALSSDVDDIEDLDIINWILNAINQPLDL